MEFMLTELTKYVVISINPTNLSQMLSLTKKLPVLTDNDDTYGDRSWRRRKKKEAGPDSQDGQLMELSM